MSPHGLQPRVYRVPSLVYIMPSPGPPRALPHGRPHARIPRSCERCSADEYALTHEAFAPVLAVVRLADCTSPTAFLQRATRFANERCFGNLSLTLLLHPQTERAHAEAVNEAIAALRYGCFLPSHLHLHHLHHHHHILLLTSSPSP